LSRDSPWAAPVSDQDYFSKPLFLFAPDPPRDTIPEPLIIGPEDWMFTLGEIIDLAIRIEKNGEMAYKKAREQTTNPAMATLLGRLAQDEADHQKWFIRFRAEVKADQADPAFEEMGQSILEGVLGDQAFSIQEADFSKIEDLKTLLKLSVEFEKDTLLFYEMLSAFIEDEKTLNQLNRILAEENHHVLLLEESLRNRVGLSQSPEA
jgi:rubrerythrin